MKRIIFISRDTIVFILLLFLFMGAKCTKVNAYDFVVNGIYYNVVSIEDLTCEIAPQYSHSSEYSGNFVVPSEVQYNGKTLKVVKIGSYAFAESSIVSVTIPNGITSIGSYAFCFCKNLTSVLIPNTVTYISNYVFCGCNKLESISLPVNVKKISDHAFRGCSSLKQINIPNGVPSIENETFCNCRSLTNVSIPQSVKTIKASAFEGCSALTALNFLSDVEEIGKYAFADCSTLESITIPSSCKMINNYAFNNCKIQKLVLEDSSDTLKMGFSYDEIVHDGWKFVFRYKNLFSDAEIEALYWGRPINHLVQPSKRIENIENVNDSENVGNGIFGKNIKSLIIGDLVTYNDINSNYSYSLLHNGPQYHSITFGKGISTIPDLSYNEQLDSIFIVRTSPPNAQGFSNKTYMNCTLVVPQGCRATYESANVWKNFWNIKELDLGLIPATGISLNKNTLIFNAANQTATLTATVSPSNATDKNVTWTSSNTAVATVSSTGVVISKANGTAVVTATTTDGTNLTATCNVTVSIPVLATGISLNQTTLSFNSANKTATLIASVTPSNATNKSVTWTSSNSSVATVSDAGVVTSKANGAATITATTTDGTNLTATCNVTVYEATRINIATSYAGYSTFYDSHCNYVLPNGLSAQVVTNVSNNKLIYKTIADGNNAGVVPMGTAVILVSDEKRSKTFTLASTGNNASYSGANLLHGSDETTVTMGEGDHYKLSYGPTGTQWDKAFGWYWGAQDGAPFQIEGHKAWLVVANGGTRAEGFSIDGVATEIIGIASEEEEHDIYYDIQGRRVCTPTRSGLYIKNDKKIIIK